MAEYIEREAVIADLKEQVEKGREKGRDTAECEAAELVIQRFAEYIKSFPAADVQPVRYGRWEDSGNFYFKKCSECGSKWDISITNNYFAHYCPRCGAEMENPKTIKG